MRHGEEFYFGILQPAKRRQSKIPRNAERMRNALAVQIIEEK